MSARVMNPGMMTEMSRNLGGSGRVSPNRAALARVRRDLFGPVDHVAARALAERELKAQSVLDAERWGFDFHLEMPKRNSKYDWEAIGPQEIIPEPYALRGMPYLRKHAPETPRKSNQHQASSSVRRTPNSRLIPDITAGNSERTPPQEPRVPLIGDNTNADDFVTQINSRENNCSVIQEPTTPVLPQTAGKQSSITDFMKKRKRSMNGTSKKSIVEPPEKITRNAGQIRS